MLTEKEVAAIKQRWDQEKAAYEYPLEVEQTFDTCLALFAEVARLSEALAAIPCQATRTTVPCQCEPCQERARRKEASDGSSNG